MSKTVTLEETVVDEPVMEEPSKAEPVSGLKKMMPLKPKITRWIIAVALLLISFLGLIWYFFGDRIASYLKFGPTPAAKAAALIDAATVEAAKVAAVNPPAPPVMTDEDVKSKFPPEVQARLKTETEETLLALATELKERGFKMYGSPSCFYTKAQRIVFGGNGSKARRTFEDVFIDCVQGGTVCPAEGIRAFPTWKHPAFAESKEGFKEPKDLRAMIDLLNSMDTVEIRDVTDDMPELDTTQPATQPAALPAILKPPQHDHAGHNHVEHARGVVEAGPPGDAPIRVNDPQSIKNNIDRSDFRASQGDGPKPIIRPGDEVAGMADKMSALITASMKHSGQTTSNDQSYQGGHGIGEHKVTAELDPLADRGVPTKQYHKST